MPNLLACRDYNKSDHIFIRLGIKNTLCRAKQHLIYPRIKKKVSLSDLNSSKIEKNEINQKNKENKEKCMEKTKEKGKFDKSSSFKNVSTLKNKGPSVGRNIKANEKAEDKRENNDEEKENVEGTVRWCSICNQFVNHFH